MTIEIAKYIDHTNLSPQATSKDIERLCEEAKEYGFFAVCINPYHVRQAVKLLSATKVAVACTVGFPLGQNLIDIKIAEAQRCIFEGAEELDMVINIAALKEGLTDYIKYEIHAIVKVAGDHPVKVIIECDLLTDEEKSIATKLICETGAAMVKTSTGFLKDGHGAKVEDVLHIKNTIGNAKVGIKASAGIKNLQKAKDLISAGATRLGTSASVAIVKESLAIPA